MRDRPVEWASAMSVEEHVAMVRDERHGLNASAIMHACEAECAEVRATIPTAKKRAIGVKKRRAPRK